MSDKEEQNERERLVFLENWEDVGFFPADFEEQNPIFLVEISKEFIVWAIYLITFSIRIFGWIQ